MDVSLQSCPDIKTMLVVKFRTSECEIESSFPCFGYGKWYRHIHVAVPEAIFLLHPVFYNFSIETRAWNPRAQDGIELASSLLSFSHRVTTASLYDASRIQKS